MKRFSHYAKKRIQLLSDYLVEFSSSAELELLHKIRLEVKKIKALLSVTAFSVDGFKQHKNYIPFRAIFRRAGEIRQTIILKELFRIYNIKDQSTRGLKSFEINHNKISSFQNQLSKFLSSVEKKSETLMDSFKIVGKSSFEKYLELKKMELKEKLVPRLNEDELHKTRKIIKEILYLSAIIKKSKRKLDPFYDKLQILIGQWHDKQLVLAMINPSINSDGVNILNAECETDIKKIKRLTEKFYRD